MGTDKISVIIPAYNIENYLSRTLDAVLAQTYANLEIIIVNDGSQDGTARVIDQYATQDSRIKAIHKENGGVTSARLRGVAEATGEWIAFADGDDVMEPWMYERLLKNALEYRADISHCGYQMVLPSGKILYYHNTGKVVVQDNHTGLKDLLENHIVEPGLWNKLYARSIVERFCRNVDFDGSIRINEDLLMNYYLFRESERSVFEDVCPYHYIVRQGSAANAKINANQLLHPLKVKQILFRETADEKELHSICGNHLVRQLVATATMGAKQDPKLIRPIRKYTRQKLRKMLGMVLKSPVFSKKSKITALWAAVLPGSYWLVHKVYAVVTGVDHIYEK